MSWRSRVRRGSGGTRYLLLIFHTVDGVGGASRPTIPRQDVFEVAGLEFHVSKETRCVLSGVSCKGVEEREPVGLQTAHPTPTLKERGASCSTMVYTP